MLLAVPQELPPSRLHNVAPPTWSDVIFHCMFGPNSPNHSTTAIDDSFIHAPISFVGGAEIVNTASAFQNYPNWTSELASVSVGAYVQVPHNAIYDTLGIGDFTIEFWIATSAANILIGPIQWIGVWDGPELANQSWRFVTDRNGFHFQWYENGALRQLLWQWSLGTATLLWVRTVYERYGSTLKFMLQWTTDISGIATVLSTPIARIDPPANPVPLRIGGTPQVPLGANNFMRDVRLTKGAWYRGTLPLVLSPPGSIFPPLYVDPDVHIRPLRVGQVLPPTYVDPDIFYTPITRYDPALKPTRIVDTENFFPQSQFIGPLAPFVSMVRNASYPKFEDVTISSGTGGTPMPTLPSTRNPGDVLVSMIMLQESLVDFPNLTNGDFSGAAGVGGLWRWVGTFSVPSGLTGRWFPSLAWITCDGTETAPHWDFNGQSVHWRGYVLRFSNADPNGNNLWNWSHSAYNSAFIDNVTSFPFMSSPNGGTFGATQPGDSELFWNPTQLGSSYPPGTELVPGLYLKFLITSDDQVLPDQFGYSTAYSDHTANGSSHFSVMGAPAGPNGHDVTGSGLINVPITLPSSALWYAGVLLLVATLP